MQFEWRRESGQWATNHEGRTVIGTRLECDSAGCGQQHVSLAYSDGTPSVTVAVSEKGASGGNSAEQAMARSLWELFHARDDPAVAAYLATVRLSAAVLKGNEHVWFSTLLRPGASWCERGSNRADAFSFEDRLWLVDESYCPRPSCDCGTVRLAFVDVDDASSGVPRGFDVRGPLAGPWRTVERFGSMSEGDVQRVMQAYQELHPDLPSRLAEHYAQTKAVGARGPQARGSRARPSRNAPCPCGSGRRYKGCCGRSQRPAASRRSAG